MGAALGDYFQGMEAEYDYESLKILQNLKDIFPFLIYILPCYYFLHVEILLMLYINISIYLCCREAPCLYCGISASLPC